MVVVMLAWGVAAPAGAKIAPSKLRPKLLAVSQLPKGYLLEGTSSSAIFGCSASAFPTGSLKMVSESFNYGAPKGFPLLTEDLATFKNAAGAFATLTSGLGGCGQVSGTKNGKTFTGTVTKLTFASLGNQSAAFAGHFSFSGTPLALELVVVQKGNELMEFQEGNFGSISTGSFAAFAAAAVKKL
ncbi:MAG: hypothetical protein ACHQFZ_11060 [Acidimicrobiales bacterium]